MKHLVLLNTLKEFLKKVLISIIIKLFPNKVLFCHSGKRDYLRYPLYQDLVAIGSKKKYTVLSEGFSSKQQKWKYAYVQCSASTPQGAGLNQGRCWICCSLTVSMPLIQLLTARSPLLHSQSASLIPQKSLESI